ncbi:MAG TPA: hypothetical protein VGI95_21925 [Caulobacteraceae bacterium]|jgi:type III secretion protein L
MTSLIKRHEVSPLDSAIRGVLERAAPIVAVQPAKPTVAPEILSLRGEVERLTQQLTAQQAEIEQLRQAAVDARRDGEADGRKRGRQESDSRRAEQLAKLERGVEIACAQFSEELLSLERLAGLVAREALAKVVGDPARHNELLLGAIRRQLEQLETSCIVSISVSRTDFDQSEELADLAASLARTGVDLAASDELKAGECRIKLSLGELSVGVPQQWERLEPALEALAADVVA